MVYCVHYHFTDLQVTKGIKLLKVGEKKKKKEALRLEQKKKKSDDKQ
jgi:hypothetical protein